MSEEIRIKGVVISRIFYGDYVSGALFQDGHYEFFSSREDKNIIGVAARNIDKGAIIEYNPNKDTGDIIVSKSRINPMDKIVLSPEGTDDNPENHPLETSRAWAVATRSALIQQKNALAKAKEAAQEQIRALGVQIAALEKLYGIGGGE